MNVQVDIDAYVRGELTADELTERLSTLVRANPAISGQVLGQLDQSYRAEKVPMEVFVSLVDTVRSSSRGGAVSGFSQPGDLPSQSTDSGQTRTAPPLDDDATSFNPQGPMPPGTVIKGRFVVESVLGMGGMGVVYKTRDRVREEARDRKPHVAVKVLNADFKQHGQAFIALQRECSRTQRLAHPNIATVYDFDRSDDVVFMTMELLEGTPLDRFIKRVMPREGLPFDEAWRLIDGMGQALAYAHQHGIVHADFKPGNAFVGKDGKVKVLDFGIARATKQPGQAETTLFDGSDLGALTPAYASPEMHDGMPTDPRDDVFALACVAYELLSGRHPFDKQPANTARTRNLRPRAIPGLHRRRMNALLHGLAFDRDRRSASVEHFLRELRGGGSAGMARVWLGVGVTLVIVALAAGGGWYAEQRTAKADARLVMELSRPADEAGLAITLDRLGARSAETRDRLLRSARQPLIDWHLERVRWLTDRREGRYSFSRAERLLEGAKSLYPDSALLRETEMELGREKDRGLSQLSASFERYLARGKLLADADQPEITDVLALLREMDPDYRLLRDPRLERAYLEGSREAVDGNHHERARALVRQGLEQFPDSPSLLARQRELQLQGRDSDRREQRTGDSRARISQGLEAMDTLAAFDALRPDARRLMDLASSGPVLDRLTMRLKTLLDHELKRLVESREPAEEQARALLGRYAEFLDPIYLEVKRQQIGSGRIATEPPLEIPVTAVDDDSAGHEVAAVEPPRRAQEVPGEADAARRRVEQEAVGQAEQEAAAGAEGERLARERQAQEAETRRLAEQRARREAKAVAESRHRREARVEQEKARKRALERDRLKVLELAASLRVTEAEQVLARIRGEFASDDPFLRREAPEAIARACLALAREAYRNGDHPRAVQLAERGLERISGHRQLAVVRGNAQAMLAVADAPEVIARQVPPIDLTRYTAAMAVLREYDSAGYGAQARNISAAVARRIDLLGNEDLGAAGNLLAAARRMLPDDAGLQAIEITVPIHIAIVAFAQPETHSGKTAAEYSRMMGKALAEQLGLIMKRGKLMVRMMTDPKWGKAVRYESAGHEVNRGICSSQGVSHVLTGILIPVSSAVGGGDFDNSDLDYALYECSEGKKVTKTYGVNSHRNDVFSYELEMREALVEFVGMYPFVPVADR